MRPLSVTSIVASGCFASVRRLAIAGVIAAVTLGTFVIVASAQEPVRAPWWPPIVSPPGAPPTGPVVTESYSDVPWHQKLGTFAGNELDEAIVLPYGALPQKTNVGVAASTTKPGA